MQLNLVEPIRYGTHCVGGSTHRSRVYAERTTNLKRQGRKALGISKHPKNSRHSMGMSEVRGRTHPHYFRGGPWGGGRMREKKKNNAGSIENARKDDE